MKDKLKEILKDKPTFTALILSVLWLVLYFALGGVIFKNMWYTSPAIVFAGAAASLFPLILQVLNALKFNKKRISVAVIILCPALMLSYFFFFAFVLSKLTYFLIAGAPYFITAALLGLAAFFIFAFPRLGKLAKRISAITVSAVIIIICIFGVFGATPFYISGGATVFAVDDTYQIAFATSHKSTGEVTVGNKTYYDISNGQKNVRKLHKIVIPAEELDSARSYSITTQSVVQNTAYLPTKGAKITKSYTFRPADESDGLQIYNLSDTHEVIEGPANAASYFGGKLDMLILNGDIINDLSSEYQISLIYKLAHRITGGSIPVVYSRGNHECNGYLAAELGKFVGSADRGMYYTVKVGSSLSLLVLDTNNDMSDDNALISPIASFDTIRKQQSKWLEGMQGWNDCEYNLVIAHMAYPLAGYTSDASHWGGWAKELISLTKDCDLALCGHSHRTDYFGANEGENTAPFPVVRGSIRSNRRTHGEGVSVFEFTGTAIELKGGTINIKFTNAKKQVLSEKTFKV